MTEHELHTALARDGAVLLRVPDADAADWCGLLDAIREALAGGARSIVLLGPGSAALAQLARSVAAELGPQGIRCNAVALHAGATLQDAAPAIAFLASAAASYVTGAMLEIGARVSSQAAT